MVKIEDLTVKYPDGTTAVDNITMNINDGEHLALIGANGAGKSTLILSMVGVLPSGGACIVNRLAAEADLLLAEGFIEPHFFAGYSGGRKSVLPGICSRTTVLANHCAEFIDSPFARTGVIEGNPIHRDMVWAARRIGLAYIVNVVINAEKKVVYAVAGDVEAAHAAGCAFLCSICPCQSRVK